jgi:hypothetical protein
MYVLKKDIRSLIGKVMYGGHMVDDMDSRVCNTYLELIMCDSVLDEADLFFYADSKKTGGFQAPQTSKSFEVQINSSVKCVVCVVCV